MTPLRDAYPVKKGDILRWLFTTTNLGHDWTATVAIPTQSAFQPQIQTPSESALPISAYGINETKYYQKNEIMPKLIIRMDKQSPQERGTVIKFIAELSDQSNNDFVFRYYLNGQAISDWNSTRTWTWTTTNNDIGANQIQVRSRAKNSELGGFENSADLCYDIGIIV
jgi:hypothetical protein